MTPLIINMLIVTSVLITSFISGIFGMAGGMILMGILLWILPLSQAMILHGVIQFTSNGWRSFIHRQSIYWPVIFPYCIGSILCISLFLALTITLNKTTAFIVLGSLPFIALILPKSLKLDITHKPHSIISGVLVTFFQLISGVSGPILDIFYLNKKLSKHEIIATKAMTQTIGHFIKTIYFFILFTPISSATSIDNGLGFWIFPISIGIAIIGTTLSKHILNKLQEDHFHLWTKRIVMAIGGIYLWKGALIIY